MIQGNLPMLTEAEITGEDTIDAKIQNAEKSNKICAEAYKLVVRKIH